MNLQIAIIISIFGLWISMSLFVRYFAYTDWPVWIKAIWFLVCGAVAFLPVLGAREWSAFYGSYFPLVETALYFIYIFAIILFSFTFMRDVCWLVLSWFRLLKSPFEVVGFARANWITMAVAFVCSVWALYAGMKVPDMKHVFISDPKIVQEKTIVVLSDLHISRTLNPDKVKGIVERANAVQPDVILLAGDIVDDEVKEIDDTLQLLGNLKGKQGVYFVSGNHEFYVGYQASMQALAKTGLISLEDKKIELEPEFYLAGVSDMRTTARLGDVSNAARILRDVPQEAYTLLVSHSPTPLDLPFDLQVSGHTHGGQIFPFHVFTWLGNHHLLSGYYPKERIYVSRGSGQWGPPMRLLAPAEITVIHLKPPK